MLYIFQNSEPALIGVPSAVTGSDSVSFLGNKKSAGISFFHNGSSKKTGSIVPLTKDSNEYPSRISLLNDTHSENM